MKTKTKKNLFNEQVYSTYLYNTYISYINKLYHKMFKILQLLFTNRAEIRHFRIQFTV